MAAIRTANMVGTFFLFGKFRIVLDFLAAFPISLSLSLSSEPYSFRSAFYPNCLFNLILRKVSIRVAKLEQQYFSLNFFPTLLVFGQMI